MIDPGSVKRTTRTIHSHLRSPSTAGRRTMSMMQKPARATSATPRTIAARSASGGSVVSAVRSASTLTFPSPPAVSILASPRPHVEPDCAARDAAGRRRGHAILRHDGRPSPAASRVPHPRYGPPQGPARRRAPAPARHRRGRQRPQRGGAGRRARQGGGAHRRGLQPGTHVRHAAAPGPQRPQVERQGATADRRLSAGPDARHVRRARGGVARRLGCSVQGGHQAGRRASLRPAEEVRDGGVGQGAGRRRTGCP